MSFYIDISFISRKTNNKKNNFIIIVFFIQVIVLNIVYKITI
jgi:hypothetical protein